VKKILPYIILFGGTLVTASLVIVVLMTMKPELFGRGGEGGNPQAPHDTTSAAVSTTVAVDSPKVAHAQVTAPESVATASPERAAVDTALQDSVTTLARQLQEERQKVTELTGQMQAASPAVSDSARAKNRKAMAKVFDSMQAENAAKIMSDMTDDEVKSIIGNVKKRQAAKILSALQPERAARIMR
jgi:flagellar motility protein MotE (MotC chaperone)